MQEDHNIQIEGEMPRRCNEIQTCLLDSHRTSKSHFEKLDKYPMVMKKIKQNEKKKKILDYKDYEKSSIIIKNILQILIDRLEIP